MFDDFVERIVSMVESFYNDPADSEYQRGYEAALTEVLSLAKQVESSYRCEFFDMS